MAFDTQQFFQSVFGSNIQNFDQLALQAFNYQYQNNLVYAQYCNQLHIEPSQVKTLQQIPFLPISFYKTHQVICNTCEPEQIFCSSSTTGKGISKHYIADLKWYHQSFNVSFQRFLGSPQNYTILALLPGYLERNNSSLVYMVNSLMKQSEKPLNGFYLNEFKALHDVILYLENENEPYILFGVTHALVDFSEQNKTNLQNGKIIETGGMKGRRREMIREELYKILKTNFGLNQIYSEYGMTELLSQAYSVDNGKYQTPPHMKVMITDINDPFDFLAQNKTGVINIIDLANINSCCFIQTEDIGKIDDNGFFEVLGRLDNSDIRGCSLMAL